jgi:hypothetical protein
MSYDHMLDQIPIWAFFCLISLIALLPIALGQRLGANRRRTAGDGLEGPVGNVVGATLALLGFMVALTVSSATARFDSRKEALIDGVNNIETAYRNAGLLPEPYKSESRKLYLEYVQTRIEMPKFYHDPMRLAAIDQQARALQQSLWAHAIALAEENRSCTTYVMYTNSLNAVIQIYNKRFILGAEQRIPFFVWVVLIVVTIITMLGVGFRFGLAGTRSLLASLMLAVTYAVVITLIFDLDQPGKGAIDVSQQPMYELYQRLSAQP